ncbi:hypothetical protein J4413_01665 [Candidatus Woesearchaeota archaeon]|nr:hypothetical protein [Candidatus Woesearchaeota archaeon]
MIKKNTKVIFEDGKEEQMDGGMPLTKGETIHMHKGNKIVDYEVKDKIIDCFLDEKDQVVNITYVLKKK